VLSLFPKRLITTTGAQEMIDIYANLKEHQKSLLGQLILHAGVTEACSDIVRQIQTAILSLDPASVDYDIKQHINLVINMQLWQGVVEMLEKLRNERV